MAVINRDSSDLNLLIGGAGATFTSSTTIPLPPGTAPAGGPADIAVGDFNGDNDPDLVVSNPTAAPNSITVLTGAAGADFTQATITVPQRPSEIAIADFNADGDQDLAVTTLSNSRVAILTGGAGSTFATTAGSPAGDSPVAIASGDFNADGDPDLAVTSVILNKVTILLGANLATFAVQPDQPATGAQPSEIVAADFNGDSDPDLAVTNSQDDNVTLLSGQAGPGFAAGDTIAVGDGPSAVASGDFNGDGDPDLAVSNQVAGAAAGSVSVLLGATGSTFTAAPGSPVAVGAEPLGISTGDFNADASLDLATADGGADTVTLLLGNSTAAPPPGGDGQDAASDLDRQRAGRADRQNEGKDPLFGERAGDLRVQAQGQGRRQDLRSFTRLRRRARSSTRTSTPARRSFRFAPSMLRATSTRVPAKLKWKMSGMSLSIASRR